MNAFWAYAREMLRYRSQVIAAVLCALLNAGAIGTGLVGALPILQSILGRERSLADMAADLNQRLASMGLSWRLSDPLIAALPDGPFTAVVWVMVALGVLTIVGATGNFTHQYLSLNVVHRTVTNVRRRAYRRVLHLPLKRVVTEGSTDLISRIVNDTTALMGGLTSLLSRSVAQVSKGAASFIAALVIEWRLTIVVLPVAFVMYHVIRKLGKRIRRASRSALEGQADLFGAAVEAMQGLRVVKVHTTERYESGRFHKLNKQVMRQLLKARTARALSSPVVEALSLFVLGLLVIIATKLIMDGHMRPERVLGALGALFVAGASLKPVTGLVNDIQASAAAAQRLRDLMGYEPEPGHDARLPRLARHAQTIEFVGVTFAYPGSQRPALDTVDLTVGHGQTVAVVGPNGSGKTTLLAMVPRLFEPGAGSVRIDATDIASVNVRSLRRQIGVVTQETVLFAGTIRANIAYGAEGVTEQKIIDAAKRARAHEFITKLPDGYGTLVGEQGLTLSGGQRQRVAIARAILRDPAILILDEATSMIDADSEAKIAEAVTEFAAGRTCLIVAHRLSTVLGADRIVVMDRGRIVDVGTHDELLERCEVYRLIAQNQLVQGRAAAMVGD